tara:strand:- start:469 stop:2208 length:1740 start_codon:yes stop_codon:yes gene_type:complete
LALFSGDEPFYFEMVSSITRSHSFALDAHFTNPEKDPYFEFPPIFYEVHSCRLHHTLMAADNSCYLTNIGLPLIISPGYYLGGVVGSMFTLSLIFSLQGIIFYKISNHFTTKNSSFFLALLVSLATTILVFSSRIYPEFTAGFFLLGAIYFFFFRPNTFLNIVIVGFFLGFLPFLKSFFLLFSIILLPIMIYSLLKNRHYNHAFQLSLTFSILIIIFFSILVMFAPIEGPVGVGGGYANYLTNYFSDSNSQSQFFNTLTHGFERYLFGQDYGLLIFSPLALLSIFGVKYIWSYNRQLFFLMFVPVGTFLFFMASFGAYAGGWSLPGRYIFPILPILLIPLFPLFEKYKKHIILHMLILFSTYVGVSLNIIFSRTIYGHFTIVERGDILNQVYFGLISSFPRLVSDDASLHRNLMDITFSPLFLFIIITIISIFIFFTFSSIFRTSNKTNFRKIIFVISIFIIYGLILSYAYDFTLNYYTESEISTIFYDILKRQPTQEEFLYWQNLVVNETISSDHMRILLLESDEGMITIKISEIYNEILGREPDISGMLHWKEKIINNEITFSELKNIIKNSVEAVK